MENNKIRSIYSDYIQSPSMQPKMMIHLRQANITKVVMNISANHTAEKKPINFRICFWKLLRKNVRTGSSKVSGMP